MSSPKSHGRTRLLSKGIKDGMIELGSDFANQIGFKEELFHGYLWKEGNKIIISLIESKVEGMGNLTTLFSEIERHGFRIVVPSPLPKMKTILQKKGFVQHTEIDPLYGVISIWERNNHYIE